MHTPAFAPDVLLLSDSIGVRGRDLNRDARISRQMKEFSDTLAGLLTAMVELWDLSDTQDAIELFKFVSSGIAGDELGRNDVIDRQISQLEDQIGTFFECAICIRQVNLDVTAGVRTGYDPEP